jgi:hypothetical protein
MDAHQFDALVRTLTGPRRALLGLGVALGLTAIPADARKRKHRKKKKKKKPTCTGCLAGEVCLANGSCAVTCTQSTDCASGCFCGSPSLEGPRHCTSALLFVCASLPECSGTAACPVGSHCEQTDCLGNPNRCIPLCDAS